MKFLQALAPNDEFFCGTLLFARCNVAILKDGSELNSLKHLQVFSSC